MEFLVLLLISCVSTFAHPDLQNSIWSFAFQSPHNEEAPDFLERNKFDVPSIFVIDLEARFSGDAMLVGEDSSGFFGLRKRELDDLTQAQKSQIQKMKVDWAVMKYPPHENWGNKKKRRQSLAVVISFGRPSVEKVPYFIGFLYSKNAKPGVYYVPSRFKKVGRYTSLGHLPQGQFKSETIDLKKHFIKAFPGVAYPGVSGLALEVDTRSMSGVGAIRSIEFQR